MTHKHLATLLREDVAATEPRPPLDAWVPVRLGRRRLRARRLRLAVGATAVIALGSAVAVSLGLDDGQPRTPVAAGDQSLAAHVRPVFERSVPRLTTLVVHTSADRTEVVWGDLRRQVSVVVERVDPAAVADPTGTGEVVAQRVLGAVGEDGNQSYEFADIALDRLDEINPDERFFARQTWVLQGDVRVLVIERVLAVDLNQALATFAVPVADQVEIATDPRTAALGVDPR
jgi:hypothetical protein